MRRRRQEPTAWTRALTAMALIGPALALGGVAPETLVGLAIVAALWARSLRGDRWRRPWGIELFAFAAALTLVQWLPLGSGWSDAMAPGPHAWATQAWSADFGSDGAAWPRISIFPAATLAELGRLCILGAVFWIAAQLPWTHIASTGAIGSTILVGLGLVHLATGSDAIAFVYTPHARASTSALLTTFINPNHQAGYFLLALFGSAAVYLRSVGTLGRGHTRTQACGAATLVAALGIALSGSRAALAAAILGALLAFAVGVRSDGAGRAGLRRVLLVLLGVAALLAVALPRLAARFLPLTTTSGLDVKADIARTALALIPEAPWFGTGRGTAVDLLPQVGLIDGPRITSHIETAPVTFLVEWGPLWGGALVLGGLALLGLTFRTNEDPARRLAACGLVAYAIQNLADFGWEYAGSSVLAVALLGSLAPRRRNSAAGVRHAFVVAALRGAVTAAAALDQTWWGRPARDLRVSSRAEALELARRQPLDPRLHLVFARQALSEDDLAGAKAHAQFADAARPSADAAAIVGAVALRLGERELAGDAFVRALSVSRGPERRALIEWLLPRLDVEMRVTLAGRVPSDEGEIFAALRRSSADDAVDLARRRLELDPEDPAALEVMARESLERDEVGLAYHYARLWSAARPDRPEPYLWQARALVAFRPPRVEAARDLLRGARERVGATDPGRLEEEELRLLLLLPPSAGEPADAVIARMDALLSAAQDDETRRRRRELRRRLLERFETPGAETPGGTP